jgi:hypothetical protein
VSAQLADPLRWITPPRNQGQIVTVSYACTPEGVWERTYDASDRSQAVRFARWTPKLERWAESSGPQNSVPPPARWRRVS